MAFEVMSLKLGKDVPYETEAATRSWLLLPGKITLAAFVPV